MILLYHKIDLEPKTIWWVEANIFFQQLQDLQNKKFVYLDQYDPNDENQVVITFDGVYKNVLLYALPILKKLNVPFELFISGDHVGNANDFDQSEPQAEFCDTKQLEELVKYGGRLQWHSKTHRKMDELRTMEEIEAELEIPDHLRRLDPKGFRWFAYPHGSFDDRTVSKVRMSFSGALSVIQGNDCDRYILNRVTVMNDTKFRKNKISVIIASYNYGTFLPEAIESVLRQTRAVDEIIISDDCSSDNTAEVAEYYRSLYPELITVNRNEKNLGIVDHFNKAVRIAKGDYICILGADNRMTSDYVEKCTRFMDIDDRLGVVYSDFALFGARAKLIYDSFSEEWRGAKKGLFYLIRFPEYSSEILEKQNFIHGSSFFRKKAFDSVSGYVFAEDKPEDYNLFLRISKAGWSLCKNGSSLIEYRQHSRDQANVSMVTAGELRFYKNKCHGLSNELVEARALIDVLKSPDAIKSYYFSTSDYFKFLKLQKDLYMDLKGLPVKVLFKRVFRVFILVGKVFCFRVLKAVKVKR